MKDGNMFQAVVIGAGPYGLAVASHLRAAGLDVKIFGKPMGFWHDHMPRGMWLRSPKEGSYISDPDQALTLDRYEAALGRPLPAHVPLEDFVDYGLWFQKRLLPDLDDRLVAGLERSTDGFRLLLEGGETVSAQRVVIATGLGAFAHIPTPFASLPEELASHTSAPINSDPARFSGRRVIVIGGGQSAIESAALIAEAGAEVRVLVRRPVRWLKGDSPFRSILTRANPLRAPGKIGFPGMSWLVEHPNLFKLCPRSLQEHMTARAMRPAASNWLLSRTRGVTISSGQEVDSVSRSENDGVILQVRNGEKCYADHVILATGYRIDISRYSFLPEQLLRSVHTVDGHPQLNSGFESSVPGLYFVGAPATRSFGPVCRFVVGTRFTALALTKHVARNLAGPVA